MLEIFWNTENSFPWVFVYKCLNYRTKESTFKILEIIFLILIFVYDENVYQISGNPLVRNHTATTEDSIRTNPVFYTQNNQKMKI